MRLIISVVVCLVLGSCNSVHSEGVAESNSVDVKSAKKDKKGGALQKLNPFTFSDKNRIANKLYHAVYRYDFEKVEKLLKAGANPNSCDGEGGWTDSTPLATAVYGFYDTYYREKTGETIPELSPEVRIVQLLKEAGAFMNVRPYVWHRISLCGNSSLGMTIRRAEMNGIKSGSAQMDERIEYYVRDANRLIEAFIKAGANVDKKGHLFPYDFAKNRGKITDEVANKYFALGTRPIDEAIKKGIVWEQQVDLLLKYTKLDENSLKAAKESGDPEMIEKISKLWVEQNASK